MTTSGERNQHENPVAVDGDTAPALALFGCASPPTDQTTVSTTPPAPVVSPEPAVKPQPRECSNRCRLISVPSTASRYGSRRPPNLILPTDQRLHADQTADIAIQKPNRLRVNFLNLSGGRQLFYDGKPSRFTRRGRTSTRAPPPRQLLTRPWLCSKTAIGFRCRSPIAVCRSAKPAGSASEVGNVCWPDSDPRRRLPSPGVSNSGSGLGNLDRGRSQAPTRRLLLTDKSVEGSPQMTAA